MKNSIYLICIMLLLFTVSCSDNAMRSDQEKNTTEELSSLDDGLITLKSGVKVQKIDDEYMWEGDIVLSETQLKALDETGTLLKEKPEYIGPDKTVHPVYNIPMKGTPGQEAVSRSFSISPSPYNLWAMVRFTYNSNLPSALQQTIRNALQEMESLSNLRFYNATGEPTVDPVYGFEYPYIDFVYVGDEDVSSSKLGRQGGKQEIKLADFAIGDESVVIHEIGHAIGLRHEQTRLDRDDYVDINESNLTDLGESQFEIPPTNYYQTGTYDYNSVMAYASFTSSESIVNDPSQPMYTRLDGSSIFPSDTITPLDREWINDFYIPYIARSDTYAELAQTVYKPDNTVMTPQERLDLQAQLNNGDPTPPNCCRLENDF